MATFDQLSAEQRAIIELVVQRGRSYGDLADMLDMPPSRVRELAREALADLAPVSAGRVDPDWRDQLADYVLGQQSGPESKATQGHLRRSEPARTWAFSLLDSLDTLYEDGIRPDIPAADSRVREREPVRRDRERARERPRREPATLTEDARVAVMRRRIAGGVVAAVAVALLVWLVFLRGDDDDNGGERAAQGTQTTQTAASGDVVPLGQIPMRAVGGAEAQGAVFVGVGADGQNPVIAVTTRLPRISENEEYELWLFNDRRSAVSLGKLGLDARGNYGAQGPLPENLDRYRFMDVSREPKDGNAAHSGQSVLRGRVRDFQAVEGAGGQGGAGQGGGGQGGGQQPQQP
jgi:hypothetical protein